MLKIQEEKKELLRKKDLINKRIDELCLYKSNCIRFKINQEDFYKEYDSGEENKNSFLKNWTIKRIEFLNEEMVKVDEEARFLFREMSDIEARLIELVELDNSDLVL